MSTVVLAKGARSGPGHVRFLCVARQIQKHLKAGGLGIGLAAAFVRAFADQPLEQVEFHFNEENPFMARLADLLEAVPNKRYAFYQMAIGSQPDDQGHASASDVASLIRPARFDELAALTQLALRSKAVWGYSEQFMAACREELTLTKDDLGELFVKEVDSQVVGVYSLQHLSATHVELGYLFVEPAQLRRGHGKDLILDAVRHGAASGYRTLVIQGDPHAVDFYLAVGAKQIGTRESDSVPGRFLPLFELDLKQSAVQ